MGATSNNAMTRHFSVVHYYLCGIAVRESYYRVLLRKGGG